MKRLIRRARVLRAVVLAASGQCSVCQGWFEDFNGGVCNVCRSMGHG